MSDITMQYRRMLTAYEQPTLALLAKDTAIPTLTVLRSMFSNEQVTVPAVRMHDQVADLMGELRMGSVPDVPKGNGRELCQAWVRVSWLIRTTDEGGNEVYSLSSAAQDALRSVEQLTKDRTISLNGHRIANFVRHLQRFASQVAPDRTTQIALLDAEINRLKEEKTRLLAGGNIAEVTDDEILQGFSETQTYLVDLPSDFTRVVEAYREFEAATIAKFRTEQLTTGEAIKSYMDHVEHLGTASAAGRGFEGALELLKDSALLDQVQRYIAALLDDPRAAQLLTSAERQAVRNSVGLIRDGMDRVLHQRGSVSKTLHEYISSHDVERDHELAATLRALEHELHAWMQSAGPRSKAPVDLLPGKFEVKHLRTKFYDPADDLTPLPLIDFQGNPEGARLTIEQLRGRGGPSHAALREELSARLEGGNFESVAELFHDLPDALRRPVELLALLPLARRYGLEPNDRTEVFETLRQDGTTRHLSVPRYTTARPISEEQT